MPKYLLRDIEITDYAQAAEIYNSNSHFLSAHLGVMSVDEAFIAREVSTMKSVGFRSCVITEEHSPVILGIIDFRTDAEVYLSLLMLRGTLHRQGIGQDVYSLFECQMREIDSSSIRIDVITDGNDTALAFWTHLGFQPCAPTTLVWGEKKSTALIMRKYLHEFSRPCQSLPCVKGGGTAQP